MRCPTCTAHNTDSAAWCTQCYAKLADDAPPVATPGGPPAGGPVEPTVASPTARDYSSLVAKPMRPLAPGEIVESGEGVGLVPPMLTPTVQPTPPTTPATPAPAAAATPLSMADQAAASVAAQAAMPAVEASEETHDVEGQTFRRTAEGLDWRCSLCEQWNPMEVQGCTACGAAFGRTLQDDLAGSGPSNDVTQAQALMMSVALPGMAHFMLGAQVTAFTRGLLYLLWLFGGAALAASAVASGSTILPAIPLLGGALVLLVGTAIDAMNLQAGSTVEILRPRVFLWLVVGVIGALMAAFTLSTFQAAS